MNNNGFMQDLKQFKDTRLDLKRIHIAVEVDYYFYNFANFYFTDNDKEIICKYVYDWVNNTSATAQEVVYILWDLITDKKITINDIKLYNEKVRTLINERF